MEASYSNYNYEDSIDRIDETLSGSDSNYEDRKKIPPRDSLTFKNGYYVDCSAVFVDIRGSKNLQKNHTRPVLAKIYKTYISELVAVFRSHEKIHEIYIEGDAVWGIFDTPYQSDIDEVFRIAYTSSSLIDILNIKYRKKRYSELKIGIGASYGSSLLIKSGYKGSGINEVVWLGKLVGEAADLCSKGNRSYSNREIMVSNEFHSNLNDHNQGLLVKNYDLNCYHGDVIHTTMNKWVEENG